MASSTLVLADAYKEDGEPIDVSPRHMLRRQLERLNARGLAAQVGTELEFMVFNTSYRDAWESGYRNLTKATPYSVDYALMDTTGIEPLVRRIRNSMEGAGMNVESGEEVEPNLGNSLPLRKIPLGMEIHNVEMQPGRGGQLGRSAGTHVVLSAREGHWAQLTLPSGEVRRVDVNCRATIGTIGNSEHMSISIGKAGRKRWMGRMPHNRGVTMNPIDHPHGGGEGRTSGGRHPVTPWGFPTKGKKTRKNKTTQKFIVASRHVRKKK